MLVSRVACIAKLQHKAIGYSGPLSRQLLCYRSLVSEVRSALRNLVEVVLASMLLSGDAERDRKDWPELGIKYVLPCTAQRVSLLTQYPRLPFVDDNDCGLGIAVRTYLDDLPLQATPTSPEARAEVKSKGKEWFQHSESFTGNLDLAFKLWDAVCTCPLRLTELRAWLTTLYRSTWEHSMQARRSRMRSCGTMRTSGCRSDDERSKALYRREDFGLIMYAGRIRASCFPTIDLHELSWNLMADSLLYYYLVRKQKRIEALTVGPGTQS